MHLAELCSLQELEDIRRPWRELAEASAHDTPYVLPQFMLPWLRRISDRCRCRFLAAWEGDRLLALAPMVERRVGRFGIDALVLLGFPDAPPTPPCDILVRPGHEAIVEAFFEHWISASRWDALELPVVPTESAASERLETAARDRGWPVQSATALRTFYVPVQGTWEDYHASRTKKMRQNLRRGLRHFERLGRVEFLTHPGDLGYEQARDALFSVLSRSWKDHEAGTSGWNAFLRDLMQELDGAGLLEASFLYVDGEPIAYLLEVPFKGVHFALHNGYDLRHQLGNPGQLMLAHAIEAAHRRAEPRYDFTGHKDYLHRWTETQRSFSRLRIRSRSPLARLKLAAYDWIHARRVREVHAGTDTTKDTRKREVRATRDEPDE